MKVLRAVGRALARMSYYLRATGWALLLGWIETLTSRRGRRALTLLLVAGLGVGLVLSQPVRSIDPGELGLRTNRITGGVHRLGEGWALVLPLVHRLERLPLRDQVYRPKKSTHAKGAAPFQSFEGLSLGVDVSVRYALDPERVAKLSVALPKDLGKSLIEPVIDGVLHRTFSRHTVRDIFSAKRTEIEKKIRDDLALLLAKDGVIVRDVFLGNVDLPADYRKGLESLLAEDLRAEKMRYTLKLKAKQVEQTALEAQAEAVRREKAAEATAKEQIIAARARAEAMQHVLPLKRKQIEQRRLEAEASRVVRLKLAEGNAQARRIESAGEADARRKLASAEAFRLEVTGKARSAQMARESALIAKNPLLIQKTLADKLSDKIQVIIAPPSQSGFIAQNLLGKAKGP
ncbi:MAG: prohibitin family protein [Deltaproteobacteria bacterium]|nr:prohibitin family protein [Deltaproteobacteria bacterium]